MVITSTSWCQCSIGLRGLASMAAQCSLPGPSASLPTRHIPITSLWPILTRSKRNGRTVARTGETKCESTAESREGRGLEGASENEDIKKRERERGACKNQAKVSFISLEYWEKSTAAEEGYWIAPHIYTHTAVYKASCQQGSRHEYKHTKAHTYGDAKWRANYIIGRRCLYTQTHQPAKCCCERQTDKHWQGYTSSFNISINHAYSWDSRLCTTGNIHQEADSQGDPHHVQQSHHTIKMWRPKGNSRHHAACVNAHAINSALHTNDGS